MNIYDENWNYLEKKILQKKLKNKKIVLFGASTRNQKLIEDFELEVSYICDNNSHLWGKSFFGYPVKNPDVLLNEKEDFVLITILNDFGNLRMQFGELNIKEYYFANQEDIKYINKFGRMDLVLEINEKLVRRDYKYIHIIPEEKFFINSFIIIENEFNIKEHLYIIYGINRANKNDCYNLWKLYEDKGEKFGNIILIDDFCNIKSRNNNNFMKEIDFFITNSVKIILESAFFTDYISKYLSSKEIELKEKSVLLVWGGDVVNPPFQNKIDVVKNVKQIMSTKTNFDYIHKNFGLDDFVALEGNVCAYLYIPQNYKKDQKRHSLNILLNNSGTINGNHMEVLEELKKFREEDIMIYCPLSYCDGGTSHKICEVGNRYFSERFVPVFDFMNYEVYVQFLNQIDIAVFGYEYAGGVTTISLLNEMGKKIYVKKNSDLWNDLQSKEISLYDFYNIKKETIEDFKEIKHEYDINTRKECYMDDVKKRWETMLRVYPK